MVNRGIHPASANFSRGAPGPSRAALAKACKEFESLFIQALLKEMRKSVPRGEGIFALSTGEEIFGEFMDQEFARQVAGAGGVGIARIVESRQVLEPGRHTATPAKENPGKTDIIYETGLSHKRPGGIR